VFRDGKVCISTLQIPHPEATAEDSKLNWSAVLGVSGALQSVVSLLADPNPDDPANPEAAQLFLHKRAAFERKAKECSKSSKNDLPAGFVKPVIISSSTSPDFRREDSGNFKFYRRCLEEEDDYEYDTDEQLEMEEEHPKDEQSTEVAVQGEERCG